MAEIGAERKADDFGDDYGLVSMPADIAAVLEHTPARGDDGQIRSLFVLFDNTPARYAEVWAGLDACPYLASSYWRIA